MGHKIPAELQLNLRKLEMHRTIHQLPKAAFQLDQGESELASAGVTAVIFLTPQSSATDRRRIPVSLRMEMSRESQV